MNNRVTLLLLVALSLLARIGLSRAQAAERTHPPATGSTETLASQTAEVNGTILHYVRAGEGATLVLVHGFPQDWSEFRPIIPRLAQQFTVVAADLPGIGRSAPPPGGYDAANLAAQIHGLAKALNLDRPYVVGHDLGAHVTYAYVRRFVGESPAGDTIFAGVVQQQNAAVPRPRPRCNSVHPLHFCPCGVVQTTCLPLMQEIAGAKPVRDANFRRVVHGE